MRLLVWMIGFAGGCAGIAEPDPGAGRARGDATGIESRWGEGDGTHAPTAAELVARVAGCDDVAGGPYALDSGDPATVSICGFAGALVWRADLDVDCDGKPGPECNAQTDPYFMAQTAAVDSAGDPLDAAQLPYVVIPGRSTRFDYRANGLAMGSVVAVVYGDRVVYGPLGDIGPSAIIGEASYRMADLLGIDPDPSSGGVDDGVTYIAFTGDVARVGVIENGDEAHELGVQLALALLASTD